MPDPHADIAPAVLVVDDATISDDGITAGLVARGRAVTATGPGLAASAAADRLVPDAILIITSAIADTSYLIEHWRRDAAMRDVPIVVRTSVTRRHALEHLLGIGATEIVIDPSPDTAVDAVMRLSTASPERRALRRLRRSIAAGVKPEIARDAPDALRDLFAAMQDAVVPLVAADRLGRCVAVNDAACQVSGYGLIDLIGRHLWEFAPVMQRPMTLAAWSTLTSTGTFEGHLKLRRADRSVIPIFVSATTHVVPGVHVGVIEPIATAVAGV